MSAQSNPKLTSLVPELRRLLNEQGTALLDEPTRLRGWLSDLAPSCAPERNLIMTALEEGVPQALRKLQSLDKTTLHQLALRLETNRSIASDRAQWAVLEWAQALGVRVPQLAPTNTAQSAISNRPLSNAPQSSTAQKTPTPAPQHKPAVAALNAQANTAQSLPRLVPWSPLSYMRLLVWTLWSPQNLKLYRSLHGDETATASWLFSLLIWALPLLTLLTYAARGHNTSSSLLLMFAMAPFTPFLFKALSQVGKLGCYTALATLAVSAFFMSIPISVALHAIRFTATGAVFVVAFTAGFSIALVWVHSLVISALLGLGLVIAMHFGVTLDIVPSAIALLGVSYSIAYNIKASINAGKPNLISRILLVILLLSYAAMIWSFFFNGWRML